MKPGMYEGLAFEEYLAIDALSNTRLGQLKQSPRHYHLNAGMDERAKHLVLGNLVHAGRLEVLELGERYVTMPAFEMNEDNVTTKGERTNSKTTKFYKEKVAEFERVNSDKNVVPVAWFNEMKLIVGSLCECDDAHRMLSGPGKTELTLVWEEPDSGILCKARMDRAQPSRNLFVDLKTTVDLAAFPNSFWRYGYHRQAAHYQHGWAVLNGGELLTPWIVAAEKSAPYCVQCAPVSDNALEAGRTEREQLLSLLCECHESNEWPGPASPDSWDVPSWAVRSEPLELTIGDQTVEL